MTSLVTGASGLLGSHIARQLVERGESVRALVRPGSDRSLLAKLPVEFAEGDLREPRSLPAALAGITRVYHCAARLGDWGPWSAFYEGNVLTTRNLVAACRQAGVQRLLHVSSVAAYGRPPASQRQITEQDALGQRLRRWDHYARAKMLAEQEARLFGAGTTIVRPTWIYGPGDRTILPRLVENLRAGRIRLLGDGQNLLNMVHAADVAEGAIAAGTSEIARGEAYNLSSAGELTQQQLFDALADHFDLPRVRGRANLRVAYAFGFLCEVTGHLLGRRERPSVTRHGISLLSRPTRISSDKARQQLGWQPQRRMTSELPVTLDWLAGTQQAAGVEDAPHATAAGS